MATDSMTLGRWVKRRRKALGLTQRELAERLPCSVVTIQKIEADERRPSNELAERLAACLNIAPAQRSAWVGFARAQAGSLHQWVWAQAFRPATNLPLPPSPLIGREHEVSEIGKRLLGGDVRLLTLVGPPGIGKTRLALQAAIELRDDFEEGVCFVDLAPIRAAELVAPTIARCLGLDWTGPQSPQSRLLEYLQDRQLLLVLDNFEQVTPAARLVSQLLASSPWLKVLATSRRRLPVRIGRQFRVPPLALPDLAHLPPVESLLQCPSVALFVDRASAVDPAFALTAGNAFAVATLCCRLDGLPLAIELIAPRVQLLSPEALLARLSGRLLLHSDGLQDVVDRQRTLHAAFGWSYDLLDGREQALFRRLSVFRGDWTLEAAEAVAAAGPAVPDGDIDRTDVLGLLASLVSNHLVQKVDVEGQPRFSMLETTREYAWAELEGSGEAAVGQQRHAQFFAALAESAQLQLTGANALSWLGHLEQDHDNLRAALRWALDTRQAKLALRLAGALWRFWRKRGYAGEGLGWAQAALALADDAVASRSAEEAALLPARARALAAAGMLARTLGDFALAKGLHEESLALYQSLGDRDGVALASFALGGDAGELGEVEAAKSSYQQSLALYRVLGDRRGIAVLQMVFGGLARDQGDLAQAEASFSEALQIQRERGESYTVAWCLLELGDLARIRGAYGRAAAQLEQGLAVFRELGDVETTSMALHRLGQVAADAGGYSRARAYLEESLLLSQRRGFKTEEVAALRILGRVALAQGDIEGATAPCLQSLELAQEIGQELGLAQALADVGRIKLCQGDDQRAVVCLQRSITRLKAMGYAIEIPACLEGLAQAWQARGWTRIAARLLGAAEAMRETMGVVIEPLIRDWHDQTVAAVRTALGEERWAAARAEGRAMSFDDVLALALTDAD